MRTFVKTILFLTAFNISVITNVFSHGSDKMGPNGGYILMPGSFHTELVPSDIKLAKDFKVFLLDGNLKNPTAQNSSIEVSLKLKNESLINLACPVKNSENYFLCTLPGDNSLDNSKEVIVKAKRNGVKASAAIYKLPLMLKAHH